MSKCPSCNNDFVQPFVCTTCGAEKLRDEIMRVLEQERDQLREQVKMLRDAALKAANHVKPTCGDLYKELMQALAATEPK